MISSYTVALPAPTMGDRRSQIGRVGPDSQQQQGREHRADEMGRDVGHRFPRGKVAGEGERERHRGVDVCTGEMAGGVDHRHDHQAEDQGDPDGAEVTAVLRIGDDPTAPANTRAKTASPSASARRARSGLASRVSTATSDSNASTRSGSGRGSGDLLELSPQGRRLPVLVALAGIDRAGIAAAHRDHGVGALTTSSVSGFGNSLRGRRRSRPSPRAPRG